MDSITDENLAEACSFAKEAAQKLNTLVAITGALDLVADGSQCYVIRNGRPEMSRITGTGCQCSALAAASLAANPDNPIAAAAAAIAALGLAGEIAFRHLAPCEGNASYRGRIIDAICHLTAEDLHRGARYEIR